MIRFLSLAAVLFFVYGFADAHTVLTDGPIGVTMHIEPDDAPVAAQPSRFVFWFKDLTGKLIASECQGTFSVEKDGQLIGPLQPLFASGGNTLVSIHKITFPQAGVYTVRVAGAPKSKLSFSAFRLVFDVRVSGDSADASTIRDPFPYVIAAVFPISLLLLWGFWPRRTRQP